MYRCECDAIGNGRSVLEHLAGRRDGESYVQFESGREESVFSAAGRVTAVVAPVIGNFVR